VADYDFKRVGAYNADTGKVINDSFITLRRLSEPDALALSDERNILFVANLLGESGTSGTVGKYDANTGDEFDANFIRVGGYPTALAVFRKTLFVAYFFYGPAPGYAKGSSVGTYNADIGKVINASFITGLSGSDFAALAVSDHHNELIVADSSLNTVGVYNATTGLSELTIEGLSRPIGLALSGDTLFVAEEFGTVIKDVGVIYSPNFITELEEPTAVAVRSEQ